MHQKHSNASLFHILLESRLGDCGILGLAFEFERKIKNLSRSQSSLKVLSCFVGGAPLIFLLLAKPIAVKDFDGSHRTYLRRAAKAQAYNTCNILVVWPSESGLGGGESAPVTPVRSTTYMAVPPASLVLGSKQKSPGVSNTTREQPRSKPCPPQLAFSYFVLLRTVPGSY
ncbi:hypothetical protein L207DRAFT_525859 [Hyaloscypha variabilis F]|uniref:Uncharacterized protein n=1 Tax=Hyaloscypha variabilis (strain UAMH 11265 / GT02V1 / F) TaxID=1149755 RepID=A0A2J6S191_HYAVF|nr:hypothetical protein L207DRAFT_525859 [Hyaloscypha variabilis F]